MIVGRVDVPEGPDLQVVQPVLDTGGRTGKSLVTVDGPIHARDIVRRKVEHTEEVPTVRKIVTHHDDEGLRTSIPPYLPTPGIGSRRNDLVSS